MIVLAERDVSTKPSHPLIDFSLCVLLAVVMVDMIVQALALQLESNIITRNFAPLSMLDSYFVLVFDRLADHGEP